MDLSDELIYIGNRYGQLAILLIAVLVGVMGAWEMLHDLVWIGAACLLIALLAVAVALPVVISPGSNYLRLDRAGFEVGSRRRKTRVKWEEVEAFRFNIVDDEFWVIEIEYASSVDKPVVRRILDAYNASLSDILSELVDWRTRFGPPR